MDQFVTWATAAAAVMSALTIVSFVLRSRAWRGAERWWIFYPVAAAVLWLGVLAGRVTPAVVDQLDLIFVGAMLLNLGSIFLTSRERRRSEGRGEKYREPPLIWGVAGVVGGVVLLRLIEIAAL